MEVESRQDVAWYELYLIKDDTWKVYKIQESLPDCKGSSNRIIDAETIIKAFILSQDSDYLAGPALKAYQQIPPGLVGQPEDIQLISLQSNNKTAIYKASYAIENRSVQILVYLYKLDMWRIVSINQL
jgi:hypothetical protein